MANKIVYILMLLTGFQLRALAQSDSPEYPTTILMIGVGSDNILDTYLSPYSYTGTRGDLIVEKQYEHTVHRIRAYFGRTENPGNNVYDYDFGLMYGLTHHFSLLHTDRWTLKAGPMGQLLLGCAYNDRNGNNPAQAKASLMAHLSSLVTYGFSIKNKPCALEFAFDVPVVGLAYSPQFGQSYYEEFSLGHYDNNCVFANTINTPSVNYRLLFCFPLGSTRFCVGYNGFVYQTKYNKLRYHAYVHSFVIGVNI